MHSQTGFLLRLLPVAMDAYRIRAQLWPALLSVMPLLLTAATEYRDLSALLPFATLFIICGGPWLLARVVDSCGQRCLRQLVKFWGARPAVQMLRYRNRTLHPNIKKAWRTIQADRAGIRFPTRNQEHLNPTDADVKYSQIIAETERDTRDRATYPQLRQLRAEYESLLNGLALRWMGLTAAVVALAWTCVSHSTVTIGRHSDLQLAALLSFHLGSATVVVVSLLMSLVWLFFFTPQRVYRAALSYDQQLLRSPVYPYKLSATHSAGRCCTAPHTKRPAAPFTRKIPG